MKFAQLVIGPAGCGKSTYCNTIQQHCHACGRSVHVFNLGAALQLSEFQRLHLMLESFCEHAAPPQLQSCCTSTCTAYCMQTRQQRSLSTNHLLTSVISSQSMTWCKNWIWGRMGVLHLLHTVTGVQHFQGLWVAQILR